MDQTEWVATVAATIADEIKKQRAYKSMSADALSERCAALGFPISRQIISKVESGRRGTLDIPELLVLAQALEVPPVSLVFPPNLAPFVHIAPQTELPTWEATKWFCGEEDFSPPTEPGTARAALRALRQHDRLVRFTLLSHAFATDRRREAQVASPDDYEAANEVATKLEQVAQRDRTELLKARQVVREHGGFPPPLPEPLAFIDPQTN